MTRRVAIPGDKFRPRYARSFAPTRRCAPRSLFQAPVREIIKRLNDRFGTDFTDSERLFLEQVQNDAIDREDIRRTAEANTFDKFRPGVQALSRI